MPHHVDIHIGRKLREARINRGLSQTELGDSVGVSFQQIQKYERGTNRVGGSRLWMLTEKLDVPISFFYDGLSKEKPRPEFSVQSMRMAKIFQEMPEGGLKKQIYQLIKTVNKGN